MTFSSFMRSFLACQCVGARIPVSRDVLLRARNRGLEKEKAETMRKLAAFGCLWAVAAKVPLRPPAHGQRRRGPAARVARVGNAENHGTANRSGRRSLWSLARAKRLRLANYMYHSKSASRSRTSARFRPTKYISSGCSSFGHKFDRQCSTSKKRARRV